MTKINLRLNFFFKTFLFFISIVFFLGTILILSTQYYLHFLERRLEDRTLEYLNMLGRRIDTKLIETFNTASDFIWLDSLERIRNSKNPKEELKNGLPQLGIRVKSFLHSVYYIDNYNDIVISKYDIKNKSDFFKKHYPNINYEDIVIIPNYQFTELPELTKYIQNSLSHSTVMPFLLKDSKTDNNYILINISEEKFFQFLKSYTVNSNTHLFIMDSKGHVRSHTDRENIYTPVLYSPITDKDFIDKVLKGKTFYSNYFGKKRLIVHSKSRKLSKENLYYVSAIPLSELYTESLPLSLIAVLICFLSLVFTLFLSFIFSRSLYQPLKKLMTLFSPLSKNNHDVKNEFDYIATNVKGLLQTQLKLTEDLNKTIPLAVENFLFKIFNEESDPEIEEKAMSFFNKNNISFKYPYFMVVIVRMDFSNEFYENFDREKKIKIHDETYKLFKNAFNKNYSVFILTIAKNEMCIIINVEKENSLKNILSSLKNVYSIYENQQNYLDLYFGLGRIKKGFSGLKESYNEALKSIFMISPFGSERILVYDDINQTDNDIYYSINDENQIINLLLSGKKDPLLNLIQNIIDKNIKNGNTILKIKELYIQFFKTGILALNKLDITLTDIFDEEQNNIYNNYKEKNIKELNDYLIDFYNKIVDLNKGKNNTKLNSIINYINKNFCNDIYLEGIADEFNFSPSHLSRVLKASLGMPFQNYLSNIRIKKAKYLLTESNKKIEEICKECGFNSRFTFIKMFKKLEGITPSQFRDIANKSVLTNVTN